MDEKGGRSASRNRWAWLPEQMPTVARMLRERRAKLGDAHVSMCWERGVVRCEPGWFFAREGALAVGVPWDGVDRLYADTPLPQQAFVVLRDTAAMEGAPHGSD